MGWSSLIVGRDVLKQDGLWTLGTGLEIRLYSDTWITQKPGFKVDGGPPLDPRLESRVRDLIGWDGTWDEQKVRQLVTSRDTDIILTMPIPYDRTDDKHIWPHSKEGKPQMRSVYHQLREVQAPPTVQKLSSNNGLGLWNAI